MNKKKVLFVCIHNSARSQMAEAFLKHIAGDTFEVESAGFEPGKLNPLAIEVMQEIGIDISGNQTKSVFDLYKQGKRYDFVITVCDESQAQRCPVFPGTTATQRIHWGFDDPARFQGTWEEKLSKTRAVRDYINQKINSWLKEISESPL
jgi:arsenate reductase (thioredoxin)